jgi:hypothetical protein
LKGVDQVGGHNLSITGGASSQADTAEMSEENQEKFRLPDIVAQRTNVLTGA